ncbi:MAG: zinc-ribbon and DUF3426 domain-containing protein [Methylophilaceae bacterium]|jgi:predicted Zn finger-like uncharacterized protein
MKCTTSCPQCGTHFLLNDELIAAYGGKVQCGCCEHVFNASDRLTEVGDDIITRAGEYHASVESTLQESAAAISTGAVIATKVKEATPEATLNLDTVKKSHKEPGPHSFQSILIGLLLLLALILQAAYFFRGVIASEYPQLKPTLERVCKKLKCTIDLPRNLHLISIGDSAMQEDGSLQSVINFSSSLQNNATYPQAYPNIELTLTDSDGVPVIKKLMTPKEYLASEKKFKQGLGPHEVTNIKIALLVDEASVASYRLFLLY